MRLNPFSGDVKFADFGASKELIEPKRFSMVGSPYWYEKHCYSRELND